ncbi:MAG: transcriptional regulator, AraC family [Rhizobium sp.]|nr:transcriptional regulator, AraC family [Rhizobium sp.]
MATRPAIAFWQETIGALYAIRPRDQADDRFQFRADAFHFGEAVLSAYECVAQSFDRSRARIGRDGLDHITLQFCLHGNHGRRDGGSNDQARLGDLIIADLAQAQATATSDFSSLNLTVPRRLLAPLLNAADEQNMRIIPGKAPLTALLRNHLKSLYREAPRLSARDAAMLVGPTLELAAAAVNSAITEENVSSVRQALTSEIRRYVDDHIIDGNMTAETIAASFGMSTRKLYYLFEPYGGFMSYVQEERLRRCRSELISPDRQHESIALIAERYSFAHRKSFIRAFRRSFDMTPREMRALAAEGHNLPMRHGEGSTLFDWIRALR